MTNALLLVASVAGALSVTPVAPASQPYELPSVMIVTKSSNRNEVHYAAYVDENCSPSTKAPLHPYWLMLERGPGVTEPLTRNEAHVLGIGTQEVSGDTIRFVVSGLPSRTFVAHIGRGADGVCTSWVDTTIAGADARVLGVYAKQRFLGVDYVQLTGRTPEGKIVQEQVRP